MRHLRRIFESKSYHRFNQEIIEDICIDLIDDGWTFKKFKTGFYEPKGFHITDVLKSGYVPGYYIEIDAEFYLPNFYSSQEMKDWFSKQNERERMAASVVRKLETQVGPVMVAWKTNSIEIWVREKTPIRVETQVTDFMEFEKMIKSMLEYSFYKSEFSVSSENNEITVVLKDRELSDGQTRPLSSSRFGIFMRRLKTLSDPNVEGYWRKKKKDIPQSHWDYDDLDKYEYDFEGSFSKRKCVIKFKNKRKK